MAVKMERERDQNGRLTAGAKKWKAGVYILLTQIPYAHHGYISSSVRTRVF